VKKKGEPEPGNFRGSGVHRERERGLLLSRQAALRKYDGGDTQFRGFMKIRGVMRDHNVTRGRKFPFTFVKKHEREKGDHALRSFDKRRVGRFDLISREQSNKILLAALIHSPIGSARRFAIDREAKFYAIRATLNFKSNKPQVDSIMKQ